MAVTDPSKKRFEASAEPPINVRLLYSPEKIQGIPEYAEFTPYPEVFRSDHPELGEFVKGLGQDIHTRVYLRKNLIKKKDLNDGLYEDPYTERSVYFYQKNLDVEATVRQISCDKTGLVSLPTFEHFPCDVHKILEAAGVATIGELSPKEVVEISGLSAERIVDHATNNGHSKKIKKSETFAAIPSLYSEMLRASIEKGHVLWISNMEDRLKEVLEYMIGPEQLTIVGEKKEYMGPATQPVAINPRKVIEAILSAESPSPLAQYKAYIGKFLNGVNVDKVPKDFAKFLEANGIATERSSLLKRASKSKELLAQAAIFGYSAARVLPAATVDEFHGSDGLLIGGDLATSVTYTKGMWLLYTGRTARQRAMGAALAGPSFVAPYAYYYAEGHGYPTQVNAIAGGLVMSGLASEIYKRRKAKKLKQKIQHD